MERHGMAKEDNSIFEEIDEELKQDKMYAALKKHKNTITYTLGAIVLAIIAYSSWYSKKQQHLEAITTALVDILRDPASEKSAALLGSLEEDAPSEIKPLLAILKCGKNLQVASVAGGGKDMAELLALSKQNGVDIVWKDLALLVYASYNPVSSGQLIPELTPLTEENRPFKFMAMELLAFLYLNENKTERAMEYFQKILDHRDAPNTLKSIITMISNHIKNKHGEVR